MTDKEYNGIKWTLLKAKASMRHLSPWEQKFISDISDKLDRFGRELWLSEAQWTQLNNIRKM